MPYSRTDRKAALIKAGVSQVELAEALGVVPSLISDVIAGRRVNSPQGRRVADRIAEIVGEPLEQIFPEAEQRAA